MVMENVTTTQLSKMIENPNIRVVDIRPVEFYNGWCTHNQPRSGHIKGAKSLPFKWFFYLDWPDILKAKGLSRTDTIVLYGHLQEQAQEAAEHFRRAGFSSVYLYHHFLTQWCTNWSLPMQKLENHTKLVSADWVNTLMETGGAPELKNQKHALFHCYYFDKDAYLRGHIPGARPLDSTTLESPRTWNSRSPREIEKALVEAGITHDTTVVLYGRYSGPQYDDPFPGSSAGQLCAFRCAFILMYAGVKDVRVLNGGLQAWIDEGLAVTEHEPVEKKADQFGAAIPGCPQMIADLKKAKQILKSPDQNLVCVRSYKEYIGEVSGYNYIKKRGRIPGAVFVHNGSDAYHMENYRNLDHTTREFHEIEQMWKSAGVTKNKFNAFYCGTGWRGAEAFFNAFLMGWKKIAVFDGGWFEWSSDDNNPYETGDPI